MHTEWRTRRATTSRGRFELLESRWAPAMYVGTNLDGVVDWGATALVNVFHEARSWQTRNVDGSGSWNSNLRNLIPLGENGWPLEVPFDPGDGSQMQIVHTVIPLRGAGTYKWTAEGTGTIRLLASNGLLVPTSPFNRSLTFDLTGGQRTIDLEIHDSDYGDGIGNLFMEILASDPADPIRNMDIILPGHEATHESQPFLDSYTDTLAPLANLRFMDWGSTNGNPLQTWDERTTLDSYTQTGSHGVALETMITLSNQLQQDAWFTIPAEADDNYVRNMAALVRDTLDSNLKVYIEYSNETWNSIFGQTTYVQNQGEALGLDSNRWQAGQKYVSYRSAEIWNIFEQEFGAASPDRLVKVMATQSSNVSVSNTRMNALLDPAINPTDIMPDALAIAPYFGGPVADQIASEGIVSSITVEQILDRAADHMRNRSTTDVANQRALADAFGIWLITYEGGQHLVGTRGNENNQELTDKLIAANRHPDMYDLYVEYLDMLNDGGVVLHSNFSYLGEPSKWGSWGVAEDQDQPLSEAHKYRALVHWINDNPPTNIAPLARAGEDLRLIDYGSGSVSVTLDGSASRDLDGQVIGYEWLDASGQSLATEATVDLELGIGSHTFELRATDDSGAVGSDAIEIFVTPRQSAEVLLESDFTGSEPGRNQPWDVTSQLAEQTVFGGWTIGNGFSGSAYDDVFAFVGNLGNTGETDLTDALTNDRYLSFTVDATSDHGLDLRGAAFEFTIDRIAWHAPRRYVVMSSIDGFSADSILFDTGRLTSLDPQSFNVPLPLEGYRTEEAVEFRIYGFEGQYAGHDSSLAAFRLHGAPYSTVGEVMGRHIVYEGSTHGDAVAPDKTALRTGESGGRANITSYSRGINAVAVDLTGASPGLTAADFEFRVGRTNDPSNWPLAPTPSNFEVRLGAGVNGSDRVLIRWPDQMISNTWLQVRTAAGTNTGLATDDLFYFGNQIGDTDGNGLADGGDFQGVRSNSHGFLNPAAIDDLFDINRDRRVNAIDLAIIRDHATLIGEGLPMITPTGSSFSKSANVVVVGFSDELMEKLSSGEKERIEETTPVVLSPEFELIDEAILAEYAQRRNDIASNPMNNKPDEDSTPADLLGGDA